MPFSAGWKRTQRAVRVLEHAIEAARVDELEVNSLCDTAGISPPTLYSYFPSFKDLVLTANLVLLEEEFTRIGRWAIGGDDEWDVGTTQQRLGEWSGSVLKTENALGRLQIASKARAVSGGPAALRLVLRRSAQRGTDRLRELQARRIVAPQFDAFAQTQFMNTAGLLGWWNDALPAESPVRSTSADVTLVFDHIAANLLSHPQPRPSTSNPSLDVIEHALRLPTIDPLFDEELHRILALEVELVDDRHFQVVRSALDLLIANPSGNFSIAELVARSGIPPKTLYGLFVDKEQILRVALTAFTTSTASSYVQSLQHLQESPDPLRLVIKVVNRFRDPGSQHYRLLRLNGYAAASSVSGAVHLTTVEASARLAVSGLEASQRAGLLRDDVPARTVISIILGLGGVRPVLDVLGNGLPDAVWVRQLENLFTGLLAVD